MRDLWICCMSSCFKLFLISYNLAWNLLHCANTPKEVCYMEINQEFSSIPHKKKVLLQTRLWCSKVPYPDCGTPQSQTVQRWPSDTQNTPLPDTMACIGLIITGYDKYGNERFAWSCVHVASWSPQLKYCWKWDRIELHCWDIHALVERSNGWNIKADDTTPLNQFRPCLFREVSLTSQKMTNHHSVHCT